MNYFFKLCSHTKQYLWNHRFDGLVDVQSLSHVWLFATPWIAACQASLSFTISQSLLKLMSVSDAIQPSCPLSSPSPPAFNLSQHSGLFLWASSSPQVAKVLELQLQYQDLSKEYSGFISFRIDWFDLAVQGTLKRLLQHHSSKASILQCSVLFMVQLSHPYMAIRKTIGLTICTFVGKVMSLLFNMLSRFAVAFLPRSKSLLLSWLLSPSAVILEHKKIKFVTIFIVSPSICHEVIGPDAMILVFWMLNFKAGFSLSSFTFIRRIFSSSLLSAIRVVSSAYLMLLIFLPAILTPAWASFSMAFLMIYSAYELTKQGDNIQPWHTLSPILNQSIVPCPVLTVTSWPTYRFLRWAKHIFQFHININR